MTLSAARPSAGARRLRRGALAACVLVVLAGALLVVGRRRPPDAQRLVEEAKRLLAAGDTFAAERAAAAAARAGGGAEAATVRYLARDHAERFAFEAIAAPDEADHMGHFARLHRLQEGYLAALGGDREAARALVAAVAGEVARLEVERFEGRPAPALDVPDLAGEPIRVADYRGRILVIDFWATWCVPCLRELPALEALHRELAPRGLAVLGIALDEDAAALERFLAARPLPWRQHRAAASFASPLAKRYGVRSIPETFVLDRAGRVRHVGLRGAALADAVRRLLAEPGSAPSS